MNGLCLLTICAVMTMIDALDIRKWQREWRWLIAETKGLVREMKTSTAKTTIVVLRFACFVISSFAVKSFRHFVVLVVIHCPLVQRTSPLYSLSNTNVIRNKEEQQSQRMWYVNVVLVWRIWSSLERETWGTCCTYSLTNPSTALLSWNLSASLENHHANSKFNNYLCICSF